MSDNYVWKPTQDVIDYSNIGRFMNRHAIAGYRELLGRSTEDIEWFWNAVIDDLGIEFYRPFDTLLDSSDGIPWSRWFVGGQDQSGPQLPRPACPVFASATTRPSSGRESRGRAAGSRTPSFMTETCRLSNALNRLGIGRGDAVGLFLPLVPEAVIAFLACAKIGAIAVPIFSGFGAQAVAARLAMPGRRR